MFFCEWPNLREMQLFEYRAFVLTEDRKKLDSEAQTGTVLSYSSRSKCSIVCTEDGTSERKLGKLLRSRIVMFNMDCFRGAITSVESDMTHDRCVETTLNYDTDLHNLKGSADVEQADVAYETIPKTAAEDPGRATAEECQTASTT